MCLESDLKSFKLNLVRKGEENSENNVPPGYGCGTGSNTHT